MEHFDWNICLHTSKPYQSLKSDSGRYPRIGIFISLLWHQDSNFIWPNLGEHPTDLPLHGLQPLVLFKEHGGGELFVGVSEKISVFRHREQHTIFRANYP